MSTINVQNTSTNRNAVRRSHYAKNEVAYGSLSIAASGGDATTTDKIVFNLPSKEIIHAEFSDGTTSLTLFNQSDITTGFDTANGSTLNYMISYVRGTGIPNAATGGSAGVRIELQLS